MAIGLAYGLNCLTGYRPVRSSSDGSFMDNFKSENVETQSCAIKNETEKDFFWYVFHLFQVSTVLQTIITRNR